jgi:KDO2-lipid IV(A) lauroyltransferase
MTTSNDIKPIHLSAQDRFLLMLLIGISRLPLGFLQAFGTLIGLIIFYGPATRARMVVEKNLEICFPQESEQWRKNLTKRNLMSGAQTALECAKTWGMPTDYSLNKICKIHNEHLFHEAIANGRGTICMIPHYATWEFMNAWLNKHVAPVIMYKPGRDQGVDEFVRQARGRLRATMVKADESGVRAIFKSLKTNGVCAILPDHMPQDNGGIFAPFYGISTYTGVMVPKLVAKTKCNVLVMSCMRVPGGFDIFIDAPDGEIYSDDLLTATTAMNKSVENLIARDPAHYHWTYKRFKRNQGVDAPY